MVSKRGLYVIALQRTEGQTVYSYGTGVYVGIELPPWYDGFEPTDVELEAFSREVMAYDAQEGGPQADYDVINDAVAQGRISLDEGMDLKKLLYEEWTIQRERPILERAREIFWDSLREPKIMLDNGGIIYGSECHWLSVTEWFSIAHQYTASVMVAPPTENGSWKENS